MDLEAPTNNFSHWQTPELQEWVSTFESCSPLSTHHNIKTYHQAIAELQRRFPRDIELYQKNDYFSKYNKTGTYHNYRRWMEEMEQQCEFMCD